MAGGFTAPAPWLGFSGGGSTPQGGYYTLPWWQAGGAAQGQGGYYTLPWWQAGGTFTPAPVPSSEGGGRRSERTGYRDGHRDALEQTRRKRILSEDDDIIALITAMLTKGLM